MKVDVVASEPHYLRHLLPIWAALPRENQGHVLPLFQVGHAEPPLQGRVALVAGWQDVSPLRGRCNMIYVEHGAGQTYRDRPFDPSYSASRGQRHQGVFGYIAPSETVAARWMKPSAAVGCPKMDRWINATPVTRQPTVCFAFHWPCDLTPETRTAWPHYVARIADIAAWFEDQGFRVVGHEHPKWRGVLNEQFDLNHIDVLPCEDDVFDDADILIVDNSSLAYEFALLGRPVVLLNAPWYRRDVEHGLRFWSHVPGIQVDGPDVLLGLNLWDLIHDTPLRAESERLRATAVEHVYAVTDGTSSEKAAAFIVELLDGM